MNRFCLILLGLMAQIGSCAGPDLRRAWAQMEPVMVAPVDDVRLAAMAGEDQILVLSGKPDTWQPRTLVRIGAGESEQSTVLPTRDTACVGEALIVRGGRWWYSRCSGSGVQFVRYDGAPSFAGDDDSSQVRALEWLPLDQDEPGGVLLSAEMNARTAIARIVTPSGIGETLGRFERGSDSGTTRGQAVRLTGDRIALVTIEARSNEPANSSIVLRILRHGEIRTSRIAFHERGWASVVAAAKGDDTLAIVAAPFDQSGVFAMILDPRQPDQPVTRWLTQTAPAVPYPGLRLIVSGDRFVAGWIALRERQVQIAEFDQHLTLPTVTVATDVAGSTPSISLGHVPGEEAGGVAVFWSDGRTLMLRSLAAPATGSLVAADLLRGLSEWIATREKH